MSSKELTISEFKLSELNPAPYNPRVIEPENRKGLQASIDEFGLVQLPVVNVRDGKNVIVGGNQPRKL